MTEIVVIGSIHQAVPNFNSDTLYNILNLVKPEIILLEMDSSFFTEDFKLKFPSKENEQLASEKYIRLHPKTKVRPFEFEGRNQHRIDIGSRPTDNLTTKLLDSLYKNGHLTSSQNKIVETYRHLTEELKFLANKSPEYFNSSMSDSISRKRQYYQYHRFREITNYNEEFAIHFVRKPNGERISYRDGYILAGDFWDLRNQTMARNIVRIAEENHGSRIVVLTGFLHRYYILSELQRLIHGKDIIVKEFYDYDPDP